MTPLFAKSLSGVQGFIIIHKHRYCHHNAILMKDYGQHLKREEQVNDE